MNRNQFLMKRLPNESKRYLSKGTNENKVLNRANFHKFSTVQENGLVRLHIRF